MTTHLPNLETERLIIRPFTMDDLHDIHQVYVDANWVDPDLSEAQALNERRAWLEWAVRNYDALANLDQLPYGDRAVVLKDSGQFVGSCGYVSCLGPFRELPYYQAIGEPANDGLNSTEFGLFWAIGKPYRGQGYATESARAMIDYAFQHLNLRRVVATTTYENQASMAVMRRLGMTVERNPLPEPFWFQVVGMLENPRLSNITAGQQAKEISSDQI